MSIVSEGIAHEDLLGGDDASALHHHSPPWVMQAVGSTNSPGSGSITYVDVPEMSVIITTGAEMVLILFTGSWRGELKGDSAFCVIDIDGIDEPTTEREQRWSVPWGGDAVAISFIKTLIAGEHTIKVQYKVNSGWCEWCEIKRCLQVIEFKT